MLKLFMRLSEFAIFLEELYELGGPTLIAARQDGLRVVCSPSEAMASLAKNWSCRQFFMSESRSISLPPSSDVWPARQGWIQLDAPYEDGNRLILGTLGYQSTWFDPSTGTRHRSLVTRRLYRRVEKILRRRLSFPTWVTGVRGEKPDPRKYIGHSSGAAAWYAEGNELRQEGVANVIYLPNEAVGEKP